MGVPKQTRGLVQPLRKIIDHKDNDAGELTDFLECGHQMPSRLESSQFRRCSTCPGQFPGEPTRSKEAEERRREKEKQRHAKKRKTRAQPES